jgi:hypothetical protein
VETFFVGTHQPYWLGTVDAPLCVSRRRLTGRKSYPRALAPWLLDSGGFTELTLYGRWTLSPAEYVAEARVYAREIGHLAHCAPQDHMCEPIVLRRTGLSTEAHQALTVSNYLDLRERAPELPWFPVLQGWRPDDYLRHVDAYERAGVALAGLPLVGVGTVCRRQHMDEAVEILRRLRAAGLRLHGFGLKMQGLVKAADALTSADSMAWSFHARKQGRAWCGSTVHRNCANCPRFALHWRERVLDLVARAAAGSRQLTLWDVA